MAPITFAAILWLLPAPLAFAAVPGAHAVVAPRQDGAAQASDLVRHLHTEIARILAPSFDPESSRVQFEPRGQMIERSDFALAESLDRPQGNALPTELFSKFVDEVPATGDLHLPTQQSVEDNYEIVLQGARFSDSVLFGEGTNTGWFDFDAEREYRRTLVLASGANDLQAAVAFYLDAYRTRAASESPEAWEKRASAIAWWIEHELVLLGARFADARLSEAVLRPGVLDFDAEREYRRALVLASDVQDLLDAANAYVDHYEDPARTDDPDAWTKRAAALAAWVRMERVRILQEEGEADWPVTSFAFARAKKSFDVTFQHSSFAPGAAALPFHKSYADPYDWAEDSGADHYTRHRITLVSDATAGEPGRDASALFDPGAEIELSFLLCVVRIVRPWMDFSLFRLPGWSLGPGHPPGRVSDGTPADDESELLPAVPIAFVVVRDLEMRSTGFRHRSLPSSEGGDAERSDLALGPFSFAEARPVEGSGGTSTEVVIRTPGMQVVAWVNQVVPFCPPE